MADRPRPFRFYAAEMSYFSGKVRPALRAKRVPFDEILPTTAAYRQVIVPRTGLSMIPTLDRTHEPSRPGLLRCLAPR
jgi:hypothetical protein